MDFFTHLLVGRLLATGAGSPALAWLATLFAVLPDFDTIAWVVKPLRRFVRHRGITHTLPFGVAASLLAGAVCALAGWAPFLPATLVALAAFVSHVALDVLNWGAPVLWPWRRSSLEWTIHGGFVWSAGLSVAGILALALAGPYAGALAAGMGIAFAGYLALRAGVKLWVARRNPGARLVPTWNPLVWQVLEAPA